MTQLNCSKLLTYRFTYRFVLEIVWNPAFFTTLIEFTELVLQCKKCRVPTNGLCWENMKQLNK